ncbi:2-hydroxyglutaryl-CoA dehydratase, D-component [Peptoanaerobacter stomatis]|uniref:2-hydroxyglutaryl-CoA dehydratase, D-component n=1 Tax=Peptoanaerobacter stomatis TaxID=796937 RepID=J6HIG4_9FIRM|nr:double-cubane-cluster-containing anaerobic reductase [Peptoanaerobacter stomatis]EJU24730.1 2-hydroxyglutaryl-CoA dehydratase, D-component [Peptoanaerobacter stomatis]NWO25991.1 2-hydroxyacyl-CoA dehydratase [Peptostreptococcaceae bacterium oral taxon 081]
MADNHKMWQELGMDVETHDLLCEALPQAFGDVFLSQKDRPNKMDYFNMVVADIHGIRPSELIEHQKNGGKVVGSFCIHVPDEVVIAAGAIATGLCSGSQFWVPGGEKVLPTATCPLIKASLGARFDRTCPFFRICDLFVGETTCDGKKKAWEVLSEDAPMYIMDIPQMKRQDDFEKWEKEIKNYIKKLEELTGNTVTQDSLHDAILTVNAKRKALQRLNEFRKLENIPISGRDVLLITQIAFYDDPKRFAQMVNILCDELEQRKKDNFSVYEKGTKRILLTGTPLSIPNWKLHQIIETSGGAVVCEEMCTGIRYSEALVNEEKASMEKMIENLAQRYLGNINCACFTPNKSRIDDIIRLAKEYKADGVIDVNLKFCNIYDIEGYFVEKALADAGIPCIGIETDYTDEDAEQLKTRIGAFIEMLS